MTLRPQPVEPQPGYSAVGGANPEGTYGLGRIDCTEAIPFLSFRIRCGAGVWGSSGRVAEVAE